MCARGGCGAQVSRSRIQAGLRTCAEHGRALRAGNPQLRRRRVAKFCKHPSCQLRLGAARLRGAAVYCNQHGGPWPGRPFVAPSRKFSACTPAALERSLSALSSRAKGGCAGSKLLMQILRQWTGCPDTPRARLVPLDAPHECPRLSKVDLSASRAIRLLNAAVLRRLTIEAFQALGCMRDWSPATVRPLLAAAARGPVLSDDHPIAVVHQERAFAQRRDWRALGFLFDSVVLRPVSRLWEARAHLLSLATQPAWRPFLEAVESLQGFGPFWTGILAWDCRALGVATKLPSDRLQYCPWGFTGARAGLNLLRGRPRRAPLEAAACRAWGQALLRFLHRAGPASILGESAPPYELFRVQWWCCELSKTPPRVWSGD